MCAILVLVDGTPKTTIFDGIGNVVAIFDGSSYPEYKAPEPKYGYGYGRKPEYEASESEYGSGYGRKPEFEAPPAEFGSGNVRKPSYSEESSYGDKLPRSRAMVNKAVMEKSHREGQAMGGPESGEYEKPSYGRSEEQKYRRPGGYERRGDDDSDSERPKYGEEGYGCKKYVRTSDAGVMIEKREK
ncbi:uncharacterized protein At5g39570-like [Malus sylvestris]|uniref:uncharacterized protein At5g39570-like n=1 Tax=Malus sylvestris TaxID=3752 RepID=UPI0021ACE440|nr:uncharacterized protein At5g39570-like [Malus sylvestris]